MSTPTAHQSTLKPYSSRFLKKREIRLRKNIFFSLQVRYIISGAM